MPRRDHHVRRHNNNHVFELTTSRHNHKAVQEEEVQLRGTRQAHRKGMESLALSGQARARGTSRGRPRAVPERNDRLPPRKAPKGPGGRRGHPHFDAPPPPQQQQWQPQQQHLSEIADSVDAVSDGRNTRGRPALSARRLFPESFGRSVSRGATYYRLAVPTSLPTWPTTTRTLSARQAASVSRRRCNTKEPRALGFHLESSLFRGHGLSLQEQYFARGSLLRKLLLLVGR